MQKQLFHPALFIFQGNIANYRHGERAERVYNQILHRIAECGTSGQKSSVFQRVFLHIGAQHRVGQELVDFPENAQRYREAERKGDDKQGAEVYRNPVGVVQKVDKRKTQRAEHGAAESVQNGVPVGDIVVKRTHLTQIDGAVEEQRVKNHHVGGDFQTRAPFEQRRQRHCNQAEAALQQHEHIFALGAAVRLKGAGLGRRFCHDRNDIDDRSDQGKQHEITDAPLPSDLSR